MVIKEFKDQWKWLSNFEGSPVKMDGVWFPHVEHAYQAAKSDNPEIRAKFHKLPAMSSGAAKKLGRAIPLHPDWTETNRLVTMENLVRQKFLCRTDLEKLLLTEATPLIEGNWWHDNFWGDCYCTKCASIIGLNNLGKILMKIRYEMRNFGMIFGLSNSSVTLNS